MVERSLALERCRELLNYDPKTGRLIFKHTGWLATRYYRGLPHPRVRVDGHSFMAAKVVWALHHGAWPEENLVRRNGKKDDDRIENLALQSEIEAEAWAKVKADEPLREPFLVTAIIGGSERYVGRARTDAEADALRAKALGLDLF